MDYAQTELSTATLDQVARLHGENLPIAFISSLGRPFVRTLYRAIGQAPGSCVIVGLGSAGQVAGFIAGTVSSRAMFGWILPRYGALFFGHLMLRAWSPAVLRKIAETALYMSRKPGKGNREETGREDGVEAELLSIAVSPACRKQGVGRGLLESFEAFLRLHSCRCYKVATHGPDEVSNAFYSAAGFTLNRTFVHHDRPMNEYVKAIGHKNG